MQPKLPRLSDRAVSSELSAIRNRRGLPLPVVSQDRGDGDKDHLSVTYIDLLTLLLAFFVILVGASRAPKTETTAATQTASSSTSSVTVSTAKEQIANKPQPPPAAPISVAKPVDPKPTPLDAQALLAKLKGLPTATPLSVEVEPGMASVTFPESLLFDVGRVTLRDDGYRLLKAIAARLGDAGVSFSIEGHSDSSPISTTVFASNWELSAHRATEVTRALIAGGIPAQRVRAIGYGDSQPVADNDTAEGRMKNRRVALVMHLLDTAPHADKWTVAAQPAAGTQFAP